MSRLACLLSCGALALIAGTAHASVPDPRASTVDTKLVTCPDGDLLFRVVVRNFAGNPWAGSTVMLDFGACPAFTICADPSPAYYYDPQTHRVWGTSNGQGIADFPLRVGGTCADSMVVVVVDGILFAHRYLASPDQNGDLTVNNADVAIVQSKLGSSDRTADLDGDGVVTAADVAIVQAHTGHLCPVAVPVAPSTWGKLKILYR